MEMFKELLNNLGFTIEIKNPHDKIFRKLLDRKENAVEIINKFLEKGDKITKEDIEKYNSSYISNKLRNSEADVVYKIKNENVFFIIDFKIVVLSNSTFLSSCFS